MIRFSSPFQQKTKQRPNKNHNPSLPPPPPHTHTRTQNTKKKTEIFLLTLSIKPLRHPPHKLTIRQTSSFLNLGASGFFSLAGRIRGRTRTRTVPVRDVGGYRACEEYGVLWDDADEVSPGGRREVFGVCWSLEFGVWSFFVGMSVGCTFVRLFIPV